MRDVRAEAIQPLMPLLIEIQRGLDQRLNLNRMAAQLGYSPFHFHRLFTTAVGETPRAYVERLRMEKAAYKLWISAESVLDVALSVGFRSHETFARAFTRYFGSTPLRFRNEGRAAKRRRVRQYRRWTADECILSDVRYETLRAMPLIGIRRLGDYTAIPEPRSPHDSYWPVLVDWARRKHVAYQPIAVSIFHDNPWLTRPAQQRADLCLPLASAVAGTRSIRSIPFVGGLFAAITHMGPLSTRPRAFRHLADAVHTSDTFAFPTEPAVAISMVALDGAQAVDRIDVYVPVVRKERSQ